MGLSARMIRALASLVGAGGTDVGAVYGHFSFYDMGFFFSFLVYCVKCVCTMLVSFSLFLFDSLPLLATRLLSALMLARP